MDASRESFWPMQRMTTRPILERLRESRTRHWMAFAATMGATVLCFIAAGALLPCDDANPCTPTVDTVATLLAFLAYGGLLTSIVVLVLAIRLHVLCQRALLQDVQTPYH